MTPQEEQIRIQQVLAGQPQAYAGLVHSCQDMAVLLAYNILLNREDAEEVAQDAFVKAFSRLASFRGESRFSTWLYRIVVNTALNRRQLKRRTTQNIDGVSFAPAPADSGFLSPGAMAAEHRKHIQAALHLLPLNERLCLTLFYLQELTIREVHELTGISLSHVKVLLHRGRKNLYAALERQLKSEIKQLL